MSRGGVTVITTAGGQTLGQRIADALAEAGMSQKKLAERLAEPGATHQRQESVRRQLIKWIQDKHAPDDQNARKLSRALGRPDTYFVTPRAAPPPVGGGLLSADGTESVLMEISRKLDELLRLTAGAARAEQLEDLVELLRQRSDASLASDAGVTPRPVGGERHASGELLEVGGLQTWVYFACPTCDAGELCSCGSSAEVVYA